MKERWQGRELCVERSWTALLKSLPLIQYLESAGVRMFIHLTIKELLIIHLLTILCVLMLPTVIFGEWASSLFSPVKKSTLMQTRTMYYQKPYIIDLSLQLGRQISWHLVKMTKWTVVVLYQHIIHVILTTSPLCKLAVHSWEIPVQFPSGCFNPHIHQRERWSIHCTWPSLSRLISPSAPGPLNQRTTFFPPSVSTTTLESH